LLLLIMIFIVTGPVHSGKTTLVKQVFNKLKEQGVQISGFLSERISQGREIAGYDLFDLKTEKSKPFVRKQGKREGERVGPFFLIPQVLAEAKEIILQGKKTDVLVVDEVGPLELSGKGVWPALENVLQRPPKCMLLVAREDILDDLLDLIKKKEVRVFDLKEKEVLTRITEEIKAWL